MRHRKITTHPVLLATLICLATAPLRQACSQLTPQRSAAPSASDSDTAGAAAAGTAQASGPRQWYVQDPITGQIYRQELIAKREQVSGWEAVPATRTVYVPTRTIQLVTEPRIQYVPQTNYELQPKMRGLWNPFRPPVHTWESKLVTRWVPQRVNTQRLAPKQGFVATKQTVIEHRPATRTIQREQLVSTPVQRAPGQVQTGSLRQPLATDSGPSRVASSQWQSTRSSGMSPRLAQSGAAVPFARAPLTPANRPIQAGFARLAATTLGGRSQPSYTAPLRVATTPASRVRDATQAGMNATILR